MISPKSDQCVDMSTVESPVTQIADTAVKSASASGVIFPLLLAMGSESIAVQSRISAVKTRSAKRAGEEWIIPPNHDRRESAAERRRLLTDAPTVPYFPGDGARRTMIMVSACWCHGTHAERLR